MGGVSLCLCPFKQFFNLAMAYNFIVKQIKKLDNLPWFAQSSIQGLFVGAIVAPLGPGALPVLAVLPFGDYSAIKNLRNSTKNISLLKKIFQSAASVLVNGAFTTVGPLLSYYSPFAAPTQMFYNKVIAQPTTYQTYVQLKKDTNFLMSDGQKFWLNPAQVDKLNAKVSMVTKVSEQKSSDVSLRNQFGWLDKQTLSRSNYKEVLAATTSLINDPRFKIVLSPKEQNTVLMANTVANKREAQFELEILKEKAVAELVKKQKECSDARAALAYEERQYQLTATAVNLFSGGEPGWLGRMDIDSKRQDVSTATDKVFELCN